MRVILACDQNSQYIQFWEPVAAHWSHIHGLRPTLFFIGSPHTPINREVGEVIFIPPIQGIPTSFMAQTIRLLAPSMYPSEVCLISDIDLFLLDRSFFSRYLGNYDFRRQWISLNRYHGPTTINRISMCYQIVAGNLCREIFNCDGTLSHMINFIKQWSKISLAWGTDEQILTKTLKKWHSLDPRENQWKIFFTPGLWGVKTPQSRSVSRYIENNAYQEANLGKNFYIEFEPPRPVLTNLSFIQHIIMKTWPNFIFPPITYLGVTTSQSRHPLDQQTIEKNKSVSRVRSVHPPIFPLSKLRGFRAQIRR